MVGHVSLYQLLTNARKSFDGGPAHECRCATCRNLLRGGGFRFRVATGGKRQLRERAMNGLIYLVGLIVVILFILSLLGLR
jgi:hypothetical protein